MTLELVQPGLLTLVQASPYRGTRHLGMPLAGAADPVAMAIANWLAGNSADTAALETAYAPVILRAHQNCAVGVHGAVTEVEVNGVSMSTNQTHLLGTADTLKIPAPAGGCRSYISVHGGLSGQVATSTYTPARLGGFDGTTVPAGSILAASAIAAAKPRTLPASYNIRYGIDFLLRIVAGPESEWLDMGSLLNENRTIGRRSDRIGMELEGAPLNILPGAPIQSSAVFPGTIQCPPSGVPFLLGPDAQTTGGYPRIAQVIRADRHLIGQLRPGARVRFQRIEPAEAQSLYRSKIALIRQLQPDFRLD